MSDTTDPELCSLTTNLCKLPKNLDFPEAKESFRFVWFEEFPWDCYSWWEDRIYCLEKSLQSKCSNGNTQKEANIVA